VGCGGGVSFLAARFVILFTFKNPKLLLLLPVSASCFLD
jgi:hypothetical protein